MSTYEGKGSKSGKKQSTPPEPGKGSAGAAADKQKSKRTSTEGRKPRRSKKQRIMCIVIPLVIIAILGGIGAAIGITMSQRGAPAATGQAPAPVRAAPEPAAAVPGQPMAFKVNIALPPGEDGQPPPSCSELFSPVGDRGKLDVSCRVRGWLEGHEQSRVCRGCEGKLQVRSAAECCESCAMLSMAQSAHKFQIPISRLPRLRLQSVLMPTMHLSMFVAALSALCAASTVLPRHIQASLCQGTGHADNRHQSRKPDM